MKARLLVLVVEDLPSLRESIGRALCGAGYEPLLAPDFAAAIRVLEQWTPDLVCVDLTLPRESGLDLVDFIRGARGAVKRVPILVMSDRSSPEDMANAEDAGANAFIKKPFTVERFIEHVLTLLGRRARSTHRSFRALQPVVTGNRQSATPGRPILQPGPPGPVPTTPLGTAIRGAVDTAAAHRGAEHGT